MKIYWSIHSIPCLQHVPRAARRRLWHLATPDPEFIPHRVILRSACILFPAHYLTHVVEDYLSGTWVALATLWGLIIGWNLLCLAIFNADVRAARDLLQRLATETFGPRCWTCGYDLRATPERCPECGTARYIGQPCAVRADAGGRGEEDKADRGDTVTG